MRAWIRRSIPRLLDLFAIDDSDGTAVIDISVFRCGIGKPVRGSGMKCAHSGAVCW